MTEPMMATEFELPITRQPETVPEVVGLLRDNLKALDSALLTSLTDCCDVSYAVFSWRRRRETIQAIIAALG